MAFWGKREKAKQKQIEAGTVDQGEQGRCHRREKHGRVHCAGDGSREGEWISSCIYPPNRALLRLLGYFRPTKHWDLLVLHEGRLIAAIELKSQVGSKEDDPSLGKNVNNRAEEAIGTAHDLWTAYRESVVGKHPKPFVGWMMLVEDAQRSRSPVRDASPHFPVFPEFQGASYLRRYDILCQRLMREQLYTVATVIASPRTAVTSGEYSDLSEMTSLRTFVASLAGHVAAEAARA